jgi:hypothetical protein
MENTIKNGELVNKSTQLHREKKEQLRNRDMKQVKSKTIENWLNQIKWLNHQIENYQEPKGIIETHISTKKYRDYELSFYQIWEGRTSTGGIRLEVKKIGDSMKHVYNIRVEKHSWGENRTRYFFMDMVEPFYEETLPHIVPDRFFTGFIGKIWDRIKEEITN